MAAMNRSRNTTLLSRKPTAHTISYCRSRSFSHSLIRSRWSISSLSHSGYPMLCTRAVGPDCPEPAAGERGWIWRSWEGPPFGQQGSSGVKGAQESSFMKSGYGAGDRRRRSRHRARHQTSNQVGPCIREMQSECGESNLTPWLTKCETESWQSTFQSLRFPPLVKRPLLASLRCEPYSTVDAVNRTWIRGWKASLRPA
jgi:hypothetical protein